MKKETDFQSDLIKAIKAEFPDCMILKNDEQYIQGIPDLTILCGPYWAVLEVKRSLYESYRPNQEYYIGVLNNMGFSAMICPENKDEVLRQLFSYFNYDIYK